MPVLIIRVTNSTEYRIMELLKLDVLSFILPSLSERLRGVGNKYDVLSFILTI